MKIWWPSVRSRVTAIDCTFLLNILNSKPLQSLYLTLTMRFTQLQTTSISVFILILRLAQLQTTSISVFTLTMRFTKLQTTSISLFNTDPEICLTANQFNLCIYHCPWDLINCKPLQSLYLTLTMRFAHLQTTSISVFDTGHVIYSIANCFNLCI